jgi:hypothetical protein
LWVDTFVCVMLFRSTMYEKWPLCTQRTNMLGLDFHSA